MDVCPVYYATTHSESMLIFHKGKVWKCKRETISYFIPTVNWKGMGVLYISKQHVDSFNDINVNEGANIVEKCSSCIVCRIKHQPIKIQLKLMKETRAFGKKSNLTRKLESVVPAKTMEFQGSKFEIRFTPSSPVARNS